MTVAELAKLLTDVPQDATVALEGCDCTGDLDGLLLAPKAWGKNAILLTCEGGYGGGDQWRVDENEETDE